MEGDFYATQGRPGGVFVVLILRSYMCLKASPSSLS